MVSLPSDLAPWFFGYTGVQLPCAQCLCRTPCYLLIKVFTSAASVTGDLNASEMLMNTPSHCQGERGKCCGTGGLALGKAQELQQSGNESPASLLFLPAGVWE